VIAGSPVRSTVIQWLQRFGSAAAERHAAGFLACLAESDFFDPDREVVVARAPGRLDVMGGIADYSGSLVLELPLADATFAAVQRDAEPVVRMRSRAREAAFSLPQLLSLDFAAARAFFAADPTRHWAAYAAGAFIVLAHERGTRFPGGARLLIGSTIPEGSGISSSAALEVAAMTAICEAWSVAIEPRDLALLCQKVENLVAGAPCGVMDQMTAVLGEPDRLFALLCQPAESQGHVEVPPDLAFWGIDSGVRHAVTGADYGTVRTAAFMGLRILEDLGIARDRLANVTPSEFEAVARYVSERLTGHEFLDRYGAPPDTVTAVVAEAVYPVRAATAHPIYEHARVREFARLLQDAPRRERRLGELMYASHASYSACGLGSEATDAIVSLVREAGPAAGLFGAKITGGGSGGTVAVLGRADAARAVRAVAARYAPASGREIRVFSGSSTGSAGAGVLRLPSVSSLPSSARWRTANQLEVTSGE